ncbi:hypothetical protein CPB84DRAFT_1212471 [Gymnopilus junonius]|uniref:PPIase cyclophilin-type domain-containing protein n=1 Tax=Gymnopilus junonius TaxID=109634 RepID=A0A9P5NKU0_GYMJU|nr:hypothetical protein CPB84DRAFT_1212471 [Gymnopilus junonius]
MVSTMFFSNQFPFFSLQFDLTVDDKHAGRLIFKLFNAEVPEATRHFCNLVTGKYGLGYKGSIFQPTNALTCIFLPTDDKRFTTYGEACTGSPLKPNACALGAGPDGLLISFVNDSLLQTGYRPIGEILSGSHIVRRLIKFPEDTFIVVASCRMVFAPDGDDPA